MVYTSGTTETKGIITIVGSFLKETNRLRIPPKKKDVVLATGEWSFISALGHNVCFALRNGITAAILTERPNANNILAAIEKFKIN